MLLQYVRANYLLQEETCFTETNGYPKCLLKRVLKTRNKNYKNKINNKNSNDSNDMNINNLSDKILHNLTLSLRTTPFGGFPDYFSFSHFLATSSCWKLLRSKPVQWNWRNFLKSFRKLRVLRVNTTIQRLLRY